MLQKSIDAVKLSVSAKQLVFLLFLLTLSLFMQAAAFAAVPEGVTTAITSAATDVATVGAAVILVHIGIKVWRWIRSAF